LYSKSPTNFQGRLTCIDIFATNRPDNVELFNQIDIPGIPTTHDLLYGSYLLPRLPDATDTPLYYRDFKNIDLEALLNDVRDLDWSTLFAAQSVIIRN
jgi:hypothetical protein